MSSPAKDKRGSSRSKSEDKKKKTEDERLRHSEDEAEEARRRQREEEPLDIMAKKGYYDALIGAMEEKKAQVVLLDGEIAAETKESRELEVTIARMQEWLSKNEPQIEMKKRELADLDRKLLELQEHPELAASLLKPPDPPAQALPVPAEVVPVAVESRAAAAPLQSPPATMPDALLDSSAAILEQANRLRAEFRAKVLQETAPLEFGLSSTPRGGGPEAVEIFNLQAIAESGMNVPVRCYSPAGKPFNTNPAPPAIVFFHGGGYVLGDLDTHDWLCRSLAALAGSTVVSVDYRRAPEHKYPAAIDDSYAALVWVARGGLGGHPRRLGVAGDCAGGGLAAACCLRAKEDPQGPQIAVQLLAYPWLDLRPNSSAMQHAFGDGRYGLSSAECNFYREAYAPAGDGSGRWTQELDASPFLARSLAGLPRAFIVYPVNSMLAEEAVAFVDRFRKDVGPEAVHTMRVQGPQHHFAVMANDMQTQQVVFAAATFASALLWAP